MKYYKLLRMLGITLCMLGAGSAVAQTKLLDVQFGANGAASDIGSQSHRVHAEYGNYPHYGLDFNPKMFTFYDNDLQCHVARFDNKWNENWTYGQGVRHSYPAFYWVDYGYPSPSSSIESRIAFYNSFKDALILEAIVRCDRNEAASDTEVTILGGKNGGGFALVERNGRFRFALYTGGVGNDGVWNLTDGPVSERGKYYHIVAAYDSESKKAHIWAYDGTTSQHYELNVNTSKGASITTPNNDNWLCIGGDSGEWRYRTENLFRGDIAMLRMYSGAVTESYVYGLQNAVAGKLQNANAASKRIVTDYTRLPYEIVRSEQDTNREVTVSVGGAGWQSGDQIVMKNVGDNSEFAFNVDTDGRYTISSDVMLPTQWYRCYAQRGSQRDHLGLMFVESAASQRSWMNMNLSGGEVSDLDYSKVSRIVAVDKPIPVPEEGGYLFAFMSHGRYGKLYYALSRDCHNWITLNDGKVVDEFYRGHPDICQGPDGTFYMIAVNNAKYYLGTTRDLITWTWTEMPELLAEINYCSAHKDIYPEYHVNTAYLGAPKMMYDADSGQYLISWHADNGSNGGGDHWNSMRTLYVLTRDFHTYTHPQRIFANTDFGGEAADIATIDLLIRKYGDTYYAIFKDERWPNDGKWDAGTYNLAPTDRSKGIRFAKSANLTGPYTDVTPRRTPGETWYEAPIILQKPDKSGFYLFAESYGTGNKSNNFYQYSMFTTDGDSPMGTYSREVPTFHCPTIKDYAERPNARHGHIIQINESIYQGLLRAFGSKF